MAMNVASPTEFWLDWLVPKKYASAVLENLQKALRSSGDKSVTSKKSSHEIFKVHTPTSIFKVLTVRRTTLICKKWQRNNTHLPILIKKWLQNCEHLIWIIGPVPCLKMVSMHIIYLESVFQSSFSQTLSIVLKSKTMFSQNLIQLLKSWIINYFFLVPIC